MVLQAWLEEGGGTSRKAPKRVKGGRPKCPLPPAWRCNPAPQKPARLVKSAAAALVRREEKGCFQDLEILDADHQKRAASLGSGLEFGPLRNRSSSFEARDSRGSSGQSSASFSASHIALVAFC